MSSSNVVSPRESAWLLARGIVTAIYGEPTTPNGDPDRRTEHPLVYWGHTGWEETRSRATFGFLSGADCDRAIAQRELRGARPVPVYRKRKVTP